MAYGPVALNIDFPDITQFRKGLLSHGVKAAAHLVNESRQIADLPLECLVHEEFLGDATVSGGLGMLLISPRCFSTMAVNSASCITAAA